MLQSKIMVKLIPKNGLDVVLSIDAIKECLSCEDKYSDFSNFRIRVLDKATKEINNKTFTNITYEPVKNGSRSYKEIKFHVNMAYH